MKWICNGKSYRSNRCNFSYLVLLVLGGLIMRHLAIFACLLFANLTTVWILDVTPDQFLERTYFQGIAVLVFWLNGIKA